MTFSEAIGALVKVLFITYFYNSIYTFIRKVVLLRYKGFLVWLACVLALSCGFWYLCSFLDMNEEYPASVCALVLYLQRDKWKTLDEKRSLDIYFKQTFNLSYGDFKTFSGRVVFFCASVACWIFLYSDLPKYF